jgi:hypothetical protein
METLVDIVRFLQAILRVMLQERGILFPTPFFSFLVHAEAEAEVLAFPVVCFSVEIKQAKIVQRPF